MRYNITMKNYVLLLLFTSLTSMILAVPVDIVTAKKVIDSQISHAGKGSEVLVKKITPIFESNTICFYVAELIPAGYMIVSADDNLPAVIAYSYQDNLDMEGRFLNILKYDISLRIASVSKIPEETIRKRRLQWADLVNNSNKNEILVQQWPPAGTTLTQGWLETNWTQNPPYNQMCPIDPVTGARSYAGCPAIAMAQIMNYHKTTNNILFDDGDDYYHNYAGRTFSIDNDYASHGFPSFSQLNVYLDTLNAHYLAGVSATNQDEAALSFACGIAASQVYTSEGSGTFGVSQALDAYQRFFCNTAELLFDGDTTLYTRLSQNMKDSLPAHLAIVDAAWSTGHNVVVDGYNTDNYYHLNFGWGGASNGWYLLPDQIPYSLTVIEGLIVDILKNESVSIPTVKDNSHFIVYPNPAKEYISIEQSNANSILTISNITGKTLLYKPISSGKTQIDISNLPQGIYIMNIDGKIQYARKLAIIH
jgi:hypothetical protein